MAINTYIALIHKDADSDYGASFPDLPGCVSAATNLDQILSEAKEALALHIEGMLEEGEEIPVPTPAEAIDRGDALLLAAIDVPDTLKVERINVTVPALALTRFDTFAARRGMTRSALFVEAVNRWITQDRTIPPLEYTLHSPARETNPTTETKPSGWLTDLLTRATQDPSNSEKALSAIQEALNQEPRGAVTVHAQSELSVELPEQEADALIEEIGRLVRDRMHRRPKVG
jgi:predicted RNase H-like HicB family nuclease